MKNNNFFIIYLLDTNKIYKKIGTVRIVDLGMLLPKFHPLIKENI